MGTSLQLGPVAGLVTTAHRHGADLVIVNRDPTPLDGHANRVIRDDLVAALAVLFP